MKRIFYSMMLIFGLAQGLFAQNAEHYQALFIYNFTRYIQWPSNNSQEFVIGILGKSNIYNELKTLVSNKKVGTSTIVVKQFASAAEIGKCQILFISNEVSSQVPQLAAELQKKNTLLITERSGLSRKGAGICFALEDGKQKFEISKANVEKTGLMINNQLIDMGILTD
jgi:hypothetical protein